MVTGLRYDQAMNHFLRLRWIMTHNASENPGPQLAAEYIRDRPPQINLLDHILPRFLHVSYLIQPPDADISEKWMLIASRLMIHAAIEVMTDTNLLNKGEEVIMVGIQECFAWGWVNRLEFGTNSPLKEHLLNQTRLHLEISKVPPELVRAANKVLVMEDDIWTMFGETADERSSKMEIDHSVAANARDWDSIRKEALATILAILRGTRKGNTMAEIESPLNSLQNKHRLSTTLSDVVEFLKESWYNYHREDWWGKPILTQIEEGGIEGLSQEEFKAFKIQAGIDEAMW